MKKSTVCHVRKYCDDRFFHSKRASGRELQLLRYNGGKIKSLKGALRLDFEEKLKISPFILFPLK